MAYGVIVVQACATIKDGKIHVPSHWYFILKTYGELLPGTKLVCRQSQELKGKSTLPLPDGLEAVLLEGMDTSSLIERIQGYIRARYRLRKIIKQADFVSAILPSNLGNTASAIAMKLNKPLFVEVAGENILYDKRISFKLPIKYIAYLYTRYIDLKVIHNANYVIYVSQYLVDTLLNKPRKYTIIPHTTIYNKDLYRRSDTCRSAPIRLFSANRIVKEKGLQHLLTAIRQLRDQNIDVMATLAGEGDYLNELKQINRQLGLDDYVTFPGHINAGDALWQFYRQADIMVLPTIASGEGTPKCIIEAMASCCPIVASSVGGIKLMLEEAKCGMLVPPGDVDELVKAIKTIITNTDLRKSYIDNGYLCAAEMTLEKRSEKMKQVINNIFHYK